MPVAVIAAILLVSGILRSIGFTAYNSLAFSDVGGEELTHANTLNAAVQELAAGLGIAVGALMLSSFVPLAAEHGHGPATPIVVVSRPRCGAGVHHVETLRLPRDAGAGVTGDRAE